MRTVSAVLFDLDGVLVESREATERVWLEWAGRNGIGEEELRSAMHGVRSVVRALRPELDAVAESDEIERRQAEDVEGLRVIPGAPEALRALRAERALGAADLIIHTLDELPCVLAREFDASAVLRGPLPTP